MIFVVELIGNGSKRKTAEFPEFIFKSIESQFAFHFDFFQHFFVKVFDQLLVGLIQALGDAFFEVVPQGVKSSLDFQFRAAVLINLYDAFFEIDAAFDCAQYFVTGAEHTVEQGKFLFQQLIYPHIGGVSLVQEVDDHYIETLSVAVASADALLNTLRIPWHIVINHQRAELQVDAFCGGFGGDEDLGFVAKIFG